jgi:long-chain acyl-CoA synthetase
MKIVFATKDKATSLLKIAAKVPTLKEIVIMDSADSDLIALGKNNNILVIGITELESEGSAAPVDPSPPIPDDIATICYTSGTTGMPKVFFLSFLSKHRVLYYPTQI